MPYRGLCVMRCAPLEIVVPRQEEISGAATAGLYTAIFQHVKSCDRCQMPFMKNMGRCCHVSCFSFSYLLLYFLSIGDTLRSEDTTFKIVRG